MFKTNKKRSQIHTVWDNQLGLPEIINITEAKIQDSKGLEQNIYPKNTIIIEDRAYFDLMLSRIIHSQNTFVMRIKSNTVYQSPEERDLPDGEDQDIFKNEIIVLTSNKAVEGGINEHKLRLMMV